MSLITDYKLKHIKQAHIKYIQYIYSNQIWTLYVLLQEYPKYNFF